MDNDTINVADEGMNTHEEITLGRLDGGAGLNEPENPGVDDAANDENTGVNGIENLGVDQIDNEIITKKWKTSNVQKRKRTLSQQKGNRWALIKNAEKQKMRRDTTFGKTAHDPTNISTTLRYLTLARATMISRLR